MAIKPVVRYMLLCEDWQIDPDHGRRVTIIGLISNIVAPDDQSFPLLHEEMCVFLALTEGYGQGEARIACVFEETGARVFETRPRPIQFGPDPLEVVGVPFRIRDCVFPRPGIYSIQFWYEGDLVEERSVRVR